MQRNVVGTKLPLLQKSGKEDWDGKDHSQLQKVPPLPEIQRPQARHPQTLNYQKPQGTQKPAQETQTGKYPTQTKRLGSRKGKTEL